MTVDKEGEVFGLEVAPGLRYWHYTDPVALRGREGGRGDRVAANTMLH